MSGVHSAPFDLALRRQFHPAKSACIRTDVSRINELRPLSRLYIEPSSSARCRSYAGRALSHPKTITFDQLRTDAQPNIRAGDRSKLHSCGETLSCGLNNTPSVLHAHNTHTTSLLERAPSKQVAAGPALTTYRSSTEVCENGTQHQLIADGAQGSLRQGMPHSFDGSSDESYFPHTEGVTNR